ncbi:CLASP amine-terminal protein (macronuclear) [Tetrahymena thermophila SB210]|uniref:CLASP amine-terminal protein n=1 Tax=Tetrahymena thermophila (strain SB210) TaxID=312017 RepID=Q234L4_TETTS|nr:CLASP amine-terminal protein [Tetrahymena thermophila SB210]EAR91989.2 CLASP amine-terminal protein [Tetrahymena thermophila SB210]|eukprot:XP_001012234.2 CLASP amine-terminal protein [Tetrahymena thermophila SB210]
MAEEGELQQLLEEFDDVDEHNYHRINDLLQQLSQFPINQLKEYKNSVLEILRSNLKVSETALKPTQIYTDFLSIAEPREKASFEEDIKQIVINLGDSDAQTRKYSHMFLLSWVKKFNDLNSVLRAFLSSGFSSNNQTIKQKSINSFQGIIITEARAIDWNSKEIFKVIAELLQVWQNASHTNVQKAADHALVSLSKRDEMRLAVTKLDISQMKIIKQIAEKHLILGLLPEEIENSSIILTKHKKENEQQSQQQQLQILNTTMNNTQNIQNNQQNSAQKNGTHSNDQIFSDLLSQTQKNNEIQQKKPLKEQEEIEEQNNRYKVNSHNNIGSLHKLSQQNELQIKPNGFQVKSEGFILQSENVLTYHFGILNDKHYQDLKSQKDWRAKAQAVEELEKNIQDADDLSGIEEQLEDFLDLVLDLTSDSNFKVQVTSMNIIFAIIGLKKCQEDKIFKIISSSIIEKLGDSKIAIRQLAQKIIIKHFEKFDENEWIYEIVKNIKSKSVQFKEDSLTLLEILIKDFHNNGSQENENGIDDKEQINSDENLQYNSRLPKRNIKKSKKCSFDWQRVVKELNPLIDDPKDKIKSKCLDCFISLSSTINDQNLFTQFLQQNLTKEQEIKIQRAIRPQVQSSQIHNRLDKSGNLNRGIDYSSYSYLDPESNMHFSFANIKKNEKSEENKYLPSSANPSSLNRSINRQFISPDIPRKQTQATKNSSENDFKINTYNLLDTKGGRYSSGSNQQSYSAMEESTSVGSSIQQTPNQPDSIKKQTNNFEKDCLDYLGNPFEKRPPPAKFSSAQKSQKSTFEVALEQQNQMDKRTNSTANSDRNKSYNMLESTSSNINTGSPNLKKTMKSSINTGEGNNYTCEEDLEPLRNPENAINTVLNELKNGDWERQFNALDTIRRLIKYHHELLARSVNFSNILKEINLLIDNLRSSLAKNAMMTISEMAYKLKKHVEIQIDGTFAKLMKKGMDANVFILEEVKKALISLCTNCTPQKILSNCFQLNMKSSQSKQYVLQCFDTLILVHQEKLQQLKDFDKIVENIGNFVVDGSLEVRNCAKVALQNLSMNCIEKKKIQQILMRSKDENTVNKIISAIDSFSRGGLDSTLGATGRSTSSIYGKNSRSILQKTARNNMNTGTMYSQQSQSSNNNIDFIETYNNNTQEMNISPENIRITKTYSQQQPPHLIAPKPTKSTSISRIQRSPDVFENLPTYFSNVENSDWNVRLNSINDLEKIATEYPKELSTHKSYVKFLDCIAKLNNDQNIKVQVKSLEVFQQLIPILQDSIQINIQNVMNSVFSSCGSQNMQIKRKAEEVLQTIMENVDSQYLFEPLNNGSLFANPKSKPIIIDNLANICNEVSKRKQNIFHKSITKTIQKLLQENKIELRQPLKKLVKEVYEILEEDLFIGPLVSYKQQIMDMIE